MRTRHPPRSLGTEGNREIVLPHTRCLPTEFPNRLFRHHEAVGWKAQQLPRGNLDTRPADRRGGHQKDTHRQAPGRPARVRTRTCRGDGKAHRQASAGLGPQTPGADRQRQVGPGCAEGGAAGYPDGARGRPGVTTSPCPSARTLFTAVTEISPWPRRGSGHARTGVNVFQAPGGD